jgi:hypothetical protein
MEEHLISDLSLIPLMWPLETQNRHIAARAKRSSKELCILLYLNKDSVMFLNGTIFKNVRKSPDIPLHFFPSIFI